MLTLRRIIIVIFGTLFNIPAIVLIVNALTNSKVSTDDMYAMLFLGFLLSIVGGILWWVAYDMGRNSRKKDTDLTAIGLAHSTYIDDHIDTDSAPWSD